MKHVIAGTAGHIDHGKTALVRALTGIDTDRLEEEKRRGISIDIGFAHLDLDANHRIALIDVPGHEKFIKNMLAGIVGIDFVVLVVSADESIKPQTREHLDICGLLRIPAGVVALTKCDLVDADTAAVARLEVEEFVKASFLAGAAIVPVSAITGQGLDELRAELLRLARNAPPRGSAQHFRLPIDRSFVMPGFGTVVTGTVFAGSVRPEDEVQIYPGSRILRVRGLQVHGQPAAIANAGQRAALNITGANHNELHRGQTLGPANVLAPATVLDCSLELLASAKPLKNRAPVHFHAGTAEGIAEVRTLDNAPVVEPGSSTLVRIFLREPLLLLPGDRFILRMFSPVVTIAGGEVIDNDPPRRISRIALVKRSCELSQAPLSGRLSLFVSEARQGMPMSGLVARTGLRSHALQTALPAEVHHVGDWLIHDSVAAAIQERWRKRLADFHRANPLLPGEGKESLRSLDLPDAPAAVFESLLQSGNRFVAQSEYVRLASHKIALQDEERQALTRIEDAFAGAGLHAPPHAEVLQSCGVDPARARTLLHILLREQRLVRVSEEFIFHSSAIDTLRTLLRSRKGQRFSVGDFKDWTGVSRKYAIPLLEWLDRERWTRRDGDTRILL